MVATDTKKVRKRASRKPKPQQLSPAEQAYVSEVASLQKKVKPDLYQEYLSEVGANGTPKWTLKRKHSLTARNLQLHNELASNTSPIAVDIISPTGKTHWAGTTLSNILASPTKRQIRKKGLQAATAMIAYKRARAGLVRSTYTPWDHVSNGMPPTTVQRQEEKEYWIDRESDDPDDLPDGTIPWRKEWHYYPGLGRLVSQTKILEPLPEYWQPAWKHRWVVNCTRRKDWSCWYLGPRDEKAAQALLLAVEGDDKEKEKPRKDLAPRVPIADSTGLSFVGWQTLSPRQPIADSTGLSFVGWKTQQRPKPRLTDQPVRPQQSRPCTDMPPATPIIGPKRKLSAFYLERNEAPPPKRQRKYKTNAISAVIDEAGLSVVSWQKKQKAAARKMRGLRK